jgi:hypothetical protein
MGNEPIDDPDNPEWTEQDFARARPASELLPAWAVAALVRQPGGSSIMVAMRRQDRLASGWSIAA